MNEVDRPGFEGVLETALYYSHGDRDAVLDFYGGVLGLRQVAGWEDGTAYRVGAGVVLLFDRDLLAEREGPISAHGSIGPDHTCLRVASGEYEVWRGRLAAAGVEIVHDHEWNGGRRSFYFNDPAGNLLEIADGDLWPP